MDDSAPNTGRVERNLAALVAAGVAAVGLYDYGEGDAPENLLAVPSAVALALFLVACVVAGSAGVRLAARGIGPDRPSLRNALVGASLVAVLFADPTYASVVTTIPLVDIRRRDQPSTRRLLTAGILGMVAVLVLTEGTRRTTAEIEAMLVLALALLVVVHLGDALRRLDEAIETEAELAQLSERSRLAEDLHDSLGHHLLASSVQLRKAKTLRDRDPSGSADAVENASVAVAEAISETRLIVDATRNRASWSVESSIRELVDRIVPTGTTVQVRVTGDHDSLDASTRLVIHRVVQEALTNLIRHARATGAVVSSAVDGSAVVVEIADDGIGLAPEADDRPGGLANMRRRVESIGGTFELTSSSDGTTIRATLRR